MHLCFDEICQKEVVNINDGTCFGFADDIEIDTETRKVTKIVIRGRKRFFGLFGREEDVFIPWEEIETIGKDTILVKTLQKKKTMEKNLNIFQKFLNIFL